MSWADNVLYLFFKRVKGFSRVKQLLDQGEGDIANLFKFIMCHY